MKKKKNVKSMLAFMLVAIMLLACGCGKNGDKNVTNDPVKTLHVAAINKGYGINWLEALLEKYCADNGWDYVIYPVYEDSVMTQKIEAGKNACNYDLVFAGTNSIANEEFLMNLSDVLDTKIETGDRAGKTIGECIDSTVYASLLAEDGSCYRMPWTGGVNGLIYNSPAIERVLGTNWQAKYPCRTTNELLDLCEALQQAGLSPFIHSASTNHYSFMYEAWFAQYNGSEGMNKYFNALYTNHMGEEVSGYEATHNQGVLESAKVMESIFANGYSHSKSNSIDWEVTLTYFMSGDAAMFSNGDWNNLEMMKQFPDSDIRFMKVPVISALGEKLGITDEQLAAVVDYVDGNGEVPAVSEEIIAAVKDARSWVASYADMHNVFIPVYSEHADAAKDFLRFMASDEGQHIFSEATNGLTMCYGYDLGKDAMYDGLSEFAKTRWEIAKNAQLYIQHRAEKYSKAGLAPFYARNMAPLEVLMSRSDDRYTAQMVYNYDYTHYKQVWATIIAQIK